jgi:hypothetical protein
MGAFCLQVSDMGFLPAALLQTWLALDSNVGASKCTIVFCSHALHVCHSLSDDHLQL